MDLPPAYSPRNMSFRWHDSERPFSPFMGSSFVLWRLTSTQLTYPPFPHPSDNVQLLVSHHFISPSSFAGAIACASFFRRAIFPVGGTTAIRKSHLHCTKHRVPRTEADFHTHRVSAILPTCPHGISDPLPAPLVLLHSESRLLRCGDLHPAIQSTPPRRQVYPI